MPAAVRLTATADRPAEQLAPPRGVRRLAAGLDPLVRSSLVTMAGTVVSAGLGYVYWLVVARLAPPAEVGYASGEMSLITGLSLFTNMGVCGFVVERLPSLEGRRAWARLLKRTIWPTSMLSAAVTGVVEAVLLASGGHAAGRGPLTVVVTAVAALGLTFFTVLTFVFISARRAELSLALGAALGVAKLVTLPGYLLFAGGPGGAETLTRMWALAVVVTCVFGALVLLPRARLGRLGSPSVRRWNVPDLRSVAGHHLTSVGGLMVPYLLPTLVIYRLDAVSNAYFYATWMFGSIFFMISPAVESSLFVEGVRDGDRLGAATRRALRLLGLLLPLPVLAAVVGGRFGLLVFGPEYARHGHLLLALLAIAALPDAVTNVGVGVLRATGALRWSSVLNVAMGAVTLVGAWWLLPRLGIAGAGVAWLLAQSLGALGVSPMLVRAVRGLPAGRPPGPRHGRPAPHRGRRATGGLRQAPVTDANEAGSHWWTTQLLP